MTARRPVVTGVGVVTPLGSDLRAVSAAIASGATAIRDARSFDASAMAETRGGEIGDEDFRSAFRTPKAMKVADLRTRMAVLASARALESAGISSELPDPSRTGVIIGCSGSDMQVDAIARALKNDSTSIEDTAVFGERILAGLNPLWLLVNLPNMTSAHVSIQFEARGPNNTIMTDWIAGLQSIAEAARLVRTNEADTMLAGGADVGVLPIAYENYAQAGLFERQLSGSSFLPGDGAAVFVIEERERAIARGATILAEIEGDASCAWADDGNTLGGAVEAALQDAGWLVPDILFPAATGCPELEALELRVAAELDGRSPAAVPRFKNRTVRAALGFPLAAASVIDIGLSLAGGDRARKRALSSAVGFMGQSAALCLTIFPEAA